MDQENQEKQRLPDPWAPLQKAEASFHLSPL